MAAVEQDKSNGRQLGPRRAHELFSTSPIATMLFAKLMPRSNSCEFPRSFRGRGSLNQVKGESLAVVCSSKGFVVGPMSQKREPLLAKIVCEATTRVPNRSLADCTAGRAEEC